MKKIFSLIFPLLLTVALTVSASAATNKLSATVPANELKAGDTVKITVSLSTEEAFKSIGLTMKYDSDTFSLESGSWLLKGTALSDVNDSRNQAAAMFTSEKTVKDDIFEFTLKVKSGAYTDSYTVAIEPVLKNGSNVIPTDSASVTVKVSGALRPTGSDPVVSNGVSSVVSETSSAVDSTTNSGDGTASSTVSYMESFFESTVSSDASVPDDTSNHKDTDGANSSMTVIIVLVAVVAAVAAIVTVVAVKSKKK